jgi:DNA replication protein DnaC
MSFGTNRQPGDIGVSFPMGLPAGSGSGELDSLIFENDAGVGRATVLFGRDKDLEFLHAFVDQSSSDGGAFVLSGAPGVGKTVLLEAVAAHSADAGLRVLRAAGAEFEADLSFAGLNQVLHPL